CASGRMVADRLHHERLLPCDLAHHRTAVVDAARARLGESSKARFNNRVAGRPGIVRHRVRSFAARPNSRTQTFGQQRWRQARRTGKPTKLWRWEKAPPCSSSLQRWGTTALKSTWRHGAKAI